ncbi:MAG: hypothetical protein AAFO94_10940 [Bacteroidota bacterium]
MEDITNLKRKVNQYREVLDNTVNYRAAWKKSLKQLILDQLNMLVSESGLDATVEVKESLENLEAIVLSLGQAKSGIYEKLNSDVMRHLIKHNGSLVYQQLFNGKILVMITYPMIEGYGQPRPPKQVAIYRPEEIKPPFLVRHLEELLKEVIYWEDYDDDDNDPRQHQQRIGFNLNMAEGGNLQQ